LNHSFYQSNWFKKRRALQLLTNPIIFGGVCFLHSDQLLLVGAVDTTLALGKSDAAIMLDISPSIVAILIEGLSMAARLSTNRVSPRRTQTPIAL
jgi:hypothetical protein